MKNKWIELSSRARERDQVASRWPLGALGTQTHDYRPGRLGPHRRKSHRRTSAIRQETKQAKHFLKWNGTTRTFHQTKALFGTARNGFYYSVREVLESEKKIVASHTPRSFREKNNSLIQCTEELELKSWHTLDFEWIYTWLIFFFTHRINAVDALIIMLFGHIIFI